MKKKGSLKLKAKEEGLPPLISLYAHLKIPEDCLGEGELAGSLDHLNLPELLQILESNKKTGVLLVAVKRQKGHVLFSHGQITDGLYEQQTGEEALYTLMQEKEGQFRFLPMDVPAEDRVNKKASELIFEALNRG